MDLLFFSPDAALRVGSPSQRKTLCFLPDPAENNIKEGRTFFFSSGMYIPRCFYSLMVSVPISFFVFSFLSRTPRNCLPYSRPSIGTLSCHSVSTKTSIALLYGFNRFSPRPSSTPFSTICDKIAFRLVISVIRSPDGRVLWRPPTSILSRCWASFSRFFQMGDIFPRQETFPFVPSLFLPPRLITIHFPSGTTLG